MNIFKLEEHINSIDIYALFYEKTGMFASHTSIIVAKEHDKEIISFLEEQCISKIERTFNEGDGKSLSILENNIFIQYDKTYLFGESVINIYYAVKDIYYENIYNEFTKYRKKKLKAQREVGIVISSPTGGLTVHYNRLPKVNFSLDNYNNDFSEVNKSVQHNLKKSKNGLYLFYGQPGTGKTSYISYLSNKIKKKFIFLSSSLISSLDTPMFLTLLLERKDSVIIIEDAEQLLVSREDNRNAIVTSLLNMTDGLLGQSLNIQFICSFNTSLDNIDKAVLRKGRLTKSYEFKKLEVDKANNLLSKQGIPFFTEEPMSLADIFNFESNTGFIEKKRTKIGFGK